MTPTLSQSRKMSVAPVLISFPFQLARPRELVYIVHPMTAFLQMPIQGVSYPIQNGCHLSRASIRQFRHNDMADLERVLQEVDKEYRRLRCAAEPPLQVIPMTDLQQGAQFEATKGC